ncbi:MAG TPA: mechanosensitive ion channel family protein [Nitrosopumilaceae archaeon]|nr:mechanosensitive ion channel family protein [Nitrosopumilaceae archaeon]
MVLEFFSEYSTINILGTQMTVASLIMAAIIMTVGVIVARIISASFKKYFAANLPQNTSSSIHKILYYGIILVSFLAVVTSQGIDLSGLMVAGGIFGIVLGFAAQSVVSNLFSGIFLMFDKPAQPGDLIEIPQNKIYGKLIEITILSTRIKLFDGSVIRVPNEKVFTSEIRNVSTSPVRRLEVTLGIAYKEDVDKAIPVIKKALDRLPYVLKEPQTEVWTEQLADSSVNLRVLTWIPRDEWDQVGPIFLKEIKKELDKSGIEIPFPQRVVHFVEAKKGQVQK